MGTLEASRNDWSLIGDLVHMDVGASKNGSIPFPGPPTIVVTAGVEITGWVPSFLGGHTVARTAQSVIELVGGARYLDIDTQLDAARPGISGPVTLSPSAGYSSWDVIVGIRGRTDFGNRWFAT
jgi:hypothetical protein